MKHLEQMRTRFQLGQIIRYKNHHNSICLGKIIGLHDDYIRVKDLKGQAYFYVYKIKFEDVIG